MPKTIFETTHTESWQSRFKRLAFNFYPVYRGTGARVCFLSSDWREIHIALALSWRTRNYVGSVFGGSIFAAADPIYMIQLINNLGKEYVVWDKSAQIRFLKPVYQTIFARFVITDAILEEIKEKVKSDGKYLIDLTVQFQDKQGTVYAEVTKTLYIADKAFHKNKRQTGLAAS